MKQYTDLISREEMWKAYHKMIDSGNTVDVYDAIKNLPSVTPQPKMGQWKRINKEKYVQHAMSYYRCSECGEEIIGKHNYCPMCGCKMQEVKDEKGNNILH